MKIAIIGLGSFGLFVAQSLREYGQIVGYSRQKPAQLPDYIAEVTLEEAAGADVVVLAVPLDAYQAVLRQLRPHLRAGTLVVDVCSVKVKSRDIMLAELAGHDNILVCHPLFGPQSAANGLAGHDLIVTNAIGPLAERVVEFCEHTLQLKITHISAEEHDRVMACVHVLTFFVARGLADMSMPSMPFKTPSFDMLTALIDLNSKHSDELFLTVQHGNPYGEEVRRDLVGVFEKLERTLAAPTD